MRRKCEVFKNLSCKCAAILAAAGIIFCYALSYAQYPTSNNNPRSHVISQSAPEWKKIRGPDGNIILPCTGTKVPPPIPGEPFPFGPGPEGIPDPSGNELVNPALPQEPPSGEDPTESTQLKTLIDIYNSAYNPDQARTALDDIVKLIKDNPSLKETVAKDLNLTGTALKIWNDFNVLAVSSNGGKDFSEAQLQEIYYILGTLPEEALKSVNVITTTAPSEAGDGNLLGFTSMDVNNNVIVLNTSSPYFSGNDGAKTLAGTLYHEVGHRVQDTLSPQLQYEFYRLHLASGNDVQNYARAYGMSSYGSGDIGYEDFATMYEAWCTDSTAILARARSQASQGSSILLEKVRFMASLFAHTGSDGQTYTYIYQIDSNGSITRNEVRLGANGLPVF